MAMGIILAAKAAAIEVRLFLFSLDLLSLRRFVKILFVFFYY
jgi:hypothetical protein